MFKKILFLFFIQCFLAQNISGNIEIKARTAILQDYLSGEILYEKEPDRSIYPASMTKIMTSIIAFDLIKSGDLKLDEKLIFAFGNEEKGLSKDFIKECDHIISIPMYGFAQSYNISVSCAIVLSNIIFKIRKSKKSIFLEEKEKEEIRNEWIKNSIKNSNLILKNIEKKRAWKDSNPRPPEP